MILLQLFHLSNFDRSEIYDPLGTISYTFCNLVDNLKSELVAAADKNSPPPPPPPPHRSILE